MKQVIHTVLVLREGYIHKGYLKKTGKTLARIQLTAGGSCTRIIAKEELNKCGRNAETTAVLKRSGFQMCVGRCDYS